MCLIHVYKSHITDICIIHRSSWPPPLSVADFTSQRTDALPHLPKVAADRVLHCHSTLSSIRARTACANVAQHASTWFQWILYIIPQHPSHGQPWAQLSERILQVGREDESDSMSTWQHSELNYTLLRKATLFTLCCSLQHWVSLLLCWSALCCAVLHCAASFASYHDAPFRIILHYS